MPLMPVTNVERARDTQPIGVRVYVDPYIGESASTNWSTFVIPNTVTGQAFASRESTGAQNAEVTFKVLLTTGTWTLSWLSFKLGNSGIYTVSLDGASQGTVDGYNSPNLVNQTLSLAGIVVSAFGLHDLNFKMATKNASSSSFFGDLQQAIVLERTA